MICKVRKLRIKRAYNGGAQIQFKSKYPWSDYSYVWTDCYGEPTWNWFDYSYRVKPS